MKCSLLFAKKKNVAAEKRQKKEQKEEAEKHMAMQEKLKAVKSSHLLLQLYHLDADLAAARADKERADEELRRCGCGRPCLRTPTYTPSPQAAVYSNWQQTIRKAVRCAPAH